MQHSTIDYRCCCSCCSTSLETQESFILLNNIHNNPKKFGSLAPFLNEDSKILPLCVHFFEIEKNSVAVLKQCHIETSRICSFFINLK